MRIEESTEYLKYDFTEEELKGMSGQIARGITELKSKELQKKSVTKSLESEMAKIQANVSDLAEKINNGSEYRDVKCKIEFDFLNKVKIFTRLDTNEELKKDPMTEEELQLSLEDLPENSESEPQTEEQTEEPQPEPDKKRKKAA